MNPNSHEPVHHHRASQHMLTAWCGAIDFSLGICDSFSFKLGPACRESQSGTQARPRHACRCTAVCFSLRSQQNSSPAYIPWRHMYILFRPLEERIYPGFLSQGVEEVGMFLVAHTIIDLRQCLPMCQKPSCWCFIAVENLSVTKAEANTPPFRSTARCNGNTSKRIGWSGAKNFWPILSSGGVGKEEHLGILSVEDGPEVFLSHSTRLEDRPQALFPPLHPIILDVLPLRRAVLRKGGVFASALVTFFLDVL